MHAIKTQKNNKSVWMILGISLFIIALAVGLFLYFKGSTQKDTTASIDTSTVKKEQVQPNNPKSSPSNSLPSKTGENPPSSSPSDTPSTPPEKPTIERAGGNPTIKVVATFQQASSGYCELRLSKEGYQTLNFSSNIVVSSSYYTCSFSVPRSSLPAGNPWNVVVIHHVGTATTSSDTQELN